VKDAQPSCLSRLTTAWMEPIRTQRELAKNSVALALGRQARAFNKSYQPTEFQVGDEVLLNPHLMNLWPKSKLNPRYEGPFQVIDRVGRLAYRLRLGSQLKIHPVISVAHLVLYKRSPKPFGSRTLQAPTRSNKIEEEFEVEALLNHRYRCNATTKRWTLEFLVKFKGYDEPEMIPIQNSHDLRTDYQRSDRWNENEVAVRKERLEKISRRKAVTKN
jgi:hypothetical protein